MPSRIEWTDETWNPVTGCTKVSEGCRHCYAERVTRRFQPDRKFTDVRLHEDRLEQPLHWRKPRRVFVNSMSDLFHPDVPFAFVRRVFGVIGTASAYGHRFQVLTKRPERLLDMLDTLNECLTFEGRAPLGTAWRNLWLGVSVEDQDTADERIPLLLQTPAAVRFVSCEPLLGPVDLAPHLTCKGCGTRSRKHLPPTAIDCCPDGGPMLDWVIVGGESGPGARPMHPNWARSLRDQCVGAGVPFLFKQWGEWLPCGMVEDETAHRQQAVGGMIACRVGKKAAGRELDGRTWDQFPDTLEAQPRRRKGA